MAKTNFNKFESDTKAILGATGEDLNKLIAKIGFPMAQLTTTDKTTLIAAINSIVASALTGITHKTDNATSTITLMDSAGKVLTTIPVGFLNNEGTTLKYNATTKKIDLINDQGVILSSIPVADFLTNIGSKLVYTETTGKLALQDSAGNELSSVTIKLPVKASLQEVAAGTNDEKFVTPKGLAGITGQIDQDIKAIEIDLDDKLSKSKGGIVTGDVVYKDNLNVLDYGATLNIIKNPIAAILGGAGLSGDIIVAVPQLAPTMLFTHIRIFNYLAFNYEGSYVNIYITSYSTDATFANATVSCDAPDFLSSVEMGYNGKTTATRNKHFFILKPKVPLGYSRVSVESISLTHTGNTLTGYRDKKNYSITLAKIGERPEEYIKMVEIGQSSFVLNRFFLNRPEFEDFKSNMYRAKQVGHPFDNNNDTTIDNGGYVSNYGTHNWLEDSPFTGYGGLLTSRMANTGKNGIQIFYDIGRNVPNGGRMAFRTIAGANDTINGSVNDGAKPWQTFWTSLNLTKLSQLADDISQGIKNWVSTNFIPRLGAATKSGTITFTDSPVVPLIPTLDAHTASKKYVDDKVNGIDTSSFITDNDFKDFNLLATYKAARGTQKIE